MNIRYPIYEGVYRILTKHLVKILNIKNLFGVNSIKQGDIYPENMDFFPFFPPDTYHPDGTTEREM